MRHLLSKTGWLLLQRRRSPASGVFSIAVGSMVEALSSVDNILEHDIRHALMFAFLGLMLIAQGMADVLPARWRRAVLSLRATSVVLALSGMSLALIDMHNETMRSLLLWFTVAVIGATVGIRYFTHRRRARRS